MMMMMMISPKRNCRQSSIGVRKCYNRSRART